MRFIKFIPAVVLLLMGSCFTAPEFPVVPSIEFEEVFFKEVPGVGNPDSLIIVIKFKDGDGDLGLAPDENSGIYREKFFYVDRDGELVVYSTRNKAGYEDLLPPFEFPYTCTNWIINPTIGNEVVNDTVYYELNPDHYNIFVEYYTKNPNGSFSLFDWRTELCGTTFDGRFPLLKDQDRASPLEGRLRYAMTSIGFRQLFSLSTLKLRITIQDRALNQSNTVESPEFRLEDIRRN